APKSIPWRRWASPWRRPSRPPGRGWGPRRGPTIRGRRRFGLVARRRPAPGRSRRAAARSIPRSSSKVPPGGIDPKEPGVTRFLLRLAVLAGHVERAGGPLEEEDREAGVPERLPAVAHQPRAGRLLGVEEDARPFEVPVVVADLRRVEQHPHALDR